MDASIIILTKNAGENFRQLLVRVFSQQFDGRFEVLMVDSGSTDNTLKIAREFPVIITEIRPNEFHHGKTRNFGADLSKGSVLVYITQDALPLKNDWLQKLTNNFEHPNVAIVCGRQLPWETTKPPEKFFYVYYFPQVKIMLKRGASDYYHDNMFISNVNSAVRRDVWQQFKFSETIIMAEDKEFAKRILSAGWSIIYEPDAAVYHAHDFSLWSAFKRCIDFGVSYSHGVKGLPKSEGSAISKALRYFTEELKYLESNGYLKWLPYSMLYEVSKLLGMLLGKIRGKVYSKSVGNNPCEGH